MKLTAEMNKLKVQRSGVLRFAFLDFQSWWKIKFLPLTGVRRGES
jgi:hypothetical protein